MEIIPGYTISEKIDETLHSVVYRARRTSPDEPVIIKTLNTEIPSPAEIARIRKEYELISRLDIEGVVRVLEIVDTREGIALVMEDFGGVSLQTFVGSSVGLDFFFDMAIRLADILGHLHYHNISHRDIKPGNILLNTNTGELKLTDFGIATELTAQSDQQAYSPRALEATLAYMSPEQTGRMNCIPDYRTDFYSLGVTFYELLTGSLPFSSREPMEIIHAHIAKRPIPPHHLNPEIPEMVSEIIMKLLSKGAGERYQSGLGLKADFDECRRRIKDSGQIEDFTLGKNDFLLKFTLPQVLVGREKELGRLKAAFEKAAKGGRQFMLVSGEAGIGKSVLVNEMDKTVAAENGFFLSGKYEQFQRHVPYSAIIQAFREAARMLLSASDARIRQWKEKLLDALEPNAGIITNLIPEMRLILGEQPEMPELEPEQTRNRFQRALQNFVRVFAARKYPLVLFLDDLQWADSASIELIREMATGWDLDFFFFIGAYRRHAVSEHHPLMQTIDEISEAGTPVENLYVSALDESQVNSLLAGFLRCDPDVSAPLAAVIYEKTLGNPFFVTRFLKSLHEADYLVADPSRGWQWNLDSIRGMQVTDNVVDFMTRKINDLPAKSFAIIKLCACIGESFDLETLAAVARKPIDEIIHAAGDLVDQGFLIQKKRCYCFAHDRIQEAAYALLTGEEKEEIHYRIGTRALSQTPEEEFSSRLFYITDQLNQAHRLISPGQESSRLADLNLRAGVKAKKTTAYDAAVNYLQTGTTLLPAEPWQADYRLTYLLHTELMESRYLARYFDEAEQLFHTIVENAANKTDKARAYTIMTVLYTNTRPPAETINLGLEALRLFDVKLRINMGPLPVFSEMTKVRLRLRKIPIDKIPELPLENDPERTAFHNQLIALSTTAYYVNPNLFAMVCLKGANETLKHGLIEHSAITFIVLATLYEAILGDYETGYQMGEMALGLNEKLGNRELAGRLYHTFALFIQHWKKHLRHDVEVYNQVYRLCLDAGNLIFAAHSVNAALSTRLALGDRLDDVLDHARKYEDFISHVKDPLIESQFRENLLEIKKLKGLTEGPHTISGEEFDEDAELAKFKKEKNLFGVCFLLLYKLERNYRFGAYEEAGRIGDELDKYIRAPIGTMMVPDHYFFYCLTLLALLKSRNTGQKRRTFSIVRRYQRRMAKWARLCPENFQHKYDLVQAEFLAAKGRFREAVELYHAAVEGARENGYINNEALACERAADFYFSLNARVEAFAFLQKTHQCYRRWGAFAKQQDLEQRYPELAAKTGVFRPGQTLEMTLSEDSDSHRLDLTTVMEVSQAISGEIVLDSLLKKIMQLSVANAGAQRGFLMLNTEGKLTIEAGVESEQQETSVIKSTDLDAYQGLAKTIVNYVRRSHEPVILANASTEGPYTNDPHISQNGCKSILCLPILNKARLTGILYMENNMATDAFTEERLEFLSAIASQAAISLENARLFEQATTDGLTRLYVHRYFHFLLEQEIERSYRYDRSFSIVMMDIDDFKHFNDTYGHQLGDEVLKKVADVLRDNTRTVDIAARYGGEEFVLIFPETGAEEAATAAAKIRGLIENMGFIHHGKTLQITVSLGVATYPDHAAKKEDLITAADNALYASKRSGKNRVTVSPGA